MGKRTKGQRRKAARRKKGSGGDAIPTSKRSRSADLQASFRKGEASAELLEQARRLATELRTSGRIEAALDLAASAGRRSPGLAIEEALSALALGRAEQARAAAEAHPEAKALLAPLLAVAEGARPPNAPRGSSPLLKGVYGVGRSLARLRDGDPHRAATSLQPVKSALLPLRMDGLGEALKLLDTGVDARPFHELMRTTLGRDDDARTAILRAVVRRHPEYGIEIVESMRLVARAERHAVLRELALALAGPDAHPARLAELAAVGGPGAFRPEDEANALLYAAFGQMSEGPAAVSKALDLAAKTGADPTEVSRGHVVCRVRGGGFDDRSLEHLTGLADRLAADPAAWPLAVYVAERAAFMLNEVGRRDRAASALALARRLLDEAPIDDPDLARRLVPTEAAIRGATDPEGAKRALDAALAETPSDPELWAVRIRLAGTDAKAVADLARRAHEATGEAHFESIVREVEPAMDRVAAGDATAGACAQAFFEAVAYEGAEWSEAWALLAKARARLGVEDRAAVDGAVADVIHRELDEEDLVEFLDALSEDPLAREAWPAIAVYLSLTDEIEPPVEAALNRVLGQAEPRLLDEAIRLVHARKPEVARRLLLSHHARLPREGLLALKKVVSRTAGASQDDAFWDYASQLDARLEPEFDPFEESDPSSGPMPVEDVSEALAAFIGMHLGRPDLALDIADLLLQGPSPKNAKKLDKLLRRAGSSVEELMALLPFGGPM